MRDRLASGTAAGVVGGWSLLLTGLLAEGVDLLRAAPSLSVFALVLVRSVAVYALAGAVVGALVALAGRHRTPRSIAATTLALFALVATTSTLEASSQLRELAGLAITSPERLRSGAFHLLGGIVAAAGVAGLVLGGRLFDRVPIRRIGILLATLVLATAGCDLALRLDPPAAVDWTPRQVALVGLDGVTFRVLAPLLRAGQLPTFQRLVDEGAWGSILTYGVAASPVVWTSVVTGLRPEEHGIVDFVVREPGLYRPRPVQSTDRRAPAIWEILGRTGVSVAVVNWIVTSPPEPVAGEMVSRLRTADTVQTEPPELRTELEPLFAAPELPFQIRPIERAFRIAEHLLVSRRPGFLAIYEHPTDELAHLGWRTHEPGAFDPRRWPPTVHQEDDLLEEAYRLVDRRLGRLLTHLDPDALLVVLSDHGNRAERVPRVRVHTGRLLVALGEATLDLETGEIDLARSRAYPLEEPPWSPVVRVNVNRRGREPGGLVDPAEADRLADRLASELAAIQTVGGSPLFSSVHRGVPGDGADLVLGHSRVSKGASPAGAELVLADGGTLPSREILEVDGSITGTHDQQGVVFLHGRGVRSGYLGPRLLPSPLVRLAQALLGRIGLVDRLAPLARLTGAFERMTTIDVTPTILHALGRPVGRDMAGRAVREAVGGSRPVTWVDTYGRRAAPGTSEPPGPEQAEELDHLRALGYLN